MPWSMYQRSRSISLHNIIIYPKPCFGGGVARNPNALFLSHCCATSHHDLVPFLFPTSKTLRAAGDRTAPTAKILSQHSSRLRTEDPLKIMLRTQSRRPLLNRNRTVREALGEEPLGKSPPTVGSRWRSPLKTPSGSLWKGRDQTGRDEQRRV